MRTLIAVCLTLIVAAPARAGVFVRFKVLEPAATKLHATLGGWRHSDPWYLPEKEADLARDTWSDWIDLSSWPWHERLNRAGGIAEWPALRITVTKADDSSKIKGCRLQVQLADAPEK